MDPQVKKEYEEKLATLNSVGWKLIEKDFQELLTAAVETAPDSCEVNDQWQMRRGNIQTLRYIANLETIIRMQYEAGVNQNDSDI